MQTPPPIDDDSFAQVLQREYGLTLQSLTFSPDGEAAYGYHLITDAPEHFYLKLHLKTVKPQAVLNLTARLYELGLTFVVAPVKTKNGIYWTQINEYPLVVFPFIDGKLPIEAPMNPQQLVNVGKVLARLHQSAQAVRQVSSDLLHEDFQPMRSEEYTRILEAIPDMLTSKHPYQVKTAEMLSPLHEIIADEYKAYEELGEKLRERDLPFVLCHGDPTGGNILYTAQDDVYLIDWDGIMLAPKERDLVFFGGEYEDDVLRGYRQITSDTLLDAELLHYYQYVWNVGEICDFGTSLFFIDHSEAQHQHDFERFDHFLNYSGLRARGRGKLSDEW